MNANWDTAPNAAVGSLDGEVLAIVSDTSWILWEVGCGILASGTAHSHEQARLDADAEFGEWFNYDDVIGHLIANSQFTVDEIYGALDKLDFDYGDGMIRLSQILEVM